MFQTKLYVKEILNYLNTVTIKNEYIAEQMFNTWVHDEFKGILPDHLHPYYRNITGDYILKDLSDVEPLLGIDRSSLDIDVYRGLKSQIERDARLKYGLTDKVIINGHQYKNSDVYIKFNKLITITSMDNKNIIPLTKDIVNNFDHIKTMLSYRIPNNNYYALCEKYPENSALIKSIFYPIKDEVNSLKEVTKTAFEVAFTAENFSMLNSDINILEENERASMIECVVSTLHYIKTRWSVKSFIYEDLYPIAHESIIWNMLFLSLLTQRIRNIKTYAAHSYHIWEYLKSHGLIDYRTVLTSTQALFLYKNLPYLLKHKGTEKVLDLLSYVLLNPWNIRINNKMITQQSVDLFEDAEDYTKTAKKFPEVINKQIAEPMFDKLTEITTNPNNKLTYQELLVELEQMAGKSYGTSIDLANNIQYEKLDELFNREQDSKLEYQNDTLFEVSTDKQRKTYSNMPHNILKTKLLEIVSASNSLVYEILYARFITEQIIYRSSEKDLQFGISFIPPTSDSFISLTANEAIALLLYSIHKENDMTLEVPPTLAVITTALNKHYDVLKDMPESFATSKISKYSRSVLKYSNDAYAFVVESNSDVDGIYLPTKQLGVWEEIYSNKKLEYNNKSKSWEFSSNDTVLLRSYKIEYHVDGIFNNNLLWDYPDYWLDDHGRANITVQRILNPTTLSHFKLHDQLNVHKEKYTTVEDFSITTHNQGKLLVSMYAEAGVPCSNTLAEFIYTIGNYFDKNLFVKDIVKLELFQEETYMEYFNNNEVLNDMIREIDVSKAPKENYSKLSVTILDALYPIFDKLKVDSQHTISYRYKKLKELFVNLCSYNVAFLEAKTLTPTPYTLTCNSVINTRVKLKTKHRLHLEGVTKYKVYYRRNYNDMNSIHTVVNI